MASELPEGYDDDFLEQILVIPSSYNNIKHHQRQTAFPLGLSLDNSAHFTPTHQQQQHQQQQQRERGGRNMNMSGLFPLAHHQFENNMHPSRQHSLQHTVPQDFQGQPTTNTTVTVAHPPSIRPRVQALRGQATNPNSIAERLRRERIAERMRALQELVPSCNKTDKAAMLNRILDYVKFLWLQVKVFSMDRLGGPAKLMEEDVGATMQFLQSKAICIMPISLASLWEYDFSRMPQVLCLATNIFSIPSGLFQIDGMAFCVRKVVDPSLGNNKWYQSLLKNFDLKKNNIQASTEFALMAKSSSSSENEVVDPSLGNNKWYQSLLKNFDLKKNNIQASTEFALMAKSSSSSENEYRIARSHNIFRLNLSYDVWCWASSDTRPPMLDRTDFASWQQCIRLYFWGKENKVNILKSIDEGPFQMGPVQELLAEGKKGAPHLGLEHPKIYSDFSLKEEDRVEVQLDMGEFKIELGMQIWVKQDRLSATTTMADDCDAFDSDVDEAPTTQTMFMANLSSADPVTDEARPSYDLDILSEVQPHDHYLDAVCTHHEEHAMHDNVQLNYVVHSHADYTSDSNMILYDQYVKDNAVPVVHSNVSSIPNDAYMMIYNDMFEPHAQSVSNTSWNTPALYNGHEIIKNNNVSALVYNIEDTLEIAEIIRMKMNDKMKDPECVTHKVNVARFTKMHVANTIVEARCMELKAELSNLHGKYAIDVEPIVPRVRNNRKAHLYYLKHLKESIETIHGIVNEAKV
nr:hypothetical protein [Tanacetum cinerariifolium]